jgi:hypothetical protein
MSAYLLIVVAVLSRVIPHSWLNFTAEGGALLFFGARRPLTQAIWPVLALMGTDYYLTVYAYNYPFHVSSYLVTWTWYVAVIVLGNILLAKKLSAGRVAGAVLLASTSFFVVSNYAVWVGSAASLYPHTLAGLTACYTAALPFYRNDLLSTSLVAGLAFGLPALARKLASQHESHGKAAV